MFKIESYITPILMNYVAKYVKNIRPQDAQLSLWGGEVALQNLDLRLDVLEEELQLPFEFLSGHIHELIIHVPWTKITSEPIQITINTIEFVLKLKDPNAEPTSSRSSTERRKKISKIEETPQGYMPGLVNKIINNISIDCHNIILKYVEEDIVVSMNVQLLSFSSADENWQKAFVDVSQTRVFLRKLVLVSDLTICLDKRNSVGVIDVCQEPILYRCSLEMRMFKKYNATTVAQTSHTRVDIFSKAMEINVSSLQFPMAMRLLILMKALKDGDLKVSSETSVSNDGNEDQEGIGAADAESYLSWAWNLIPSVFPSDADHEEIEDDSGHLFHIGVYLGKLNITLKASELFSDSIVQSTRKIRYDPIFRVCLEGIYSETNMAGRKWFNTTAGVSKVLVEPLGEYASPVASQQFLVSSCDAEVTESYLEKSLFQDVDSPRKISKFVIDLEDHLDRTDENQLLSRTPAFAFDMAHFLDIPDDSKSSDFGSDLEYSNISEQLLTRIFISSITLKYNSTLLRIMDVLQELIKTYNYSPYIEEKMEAVEKIPPPSVDDFDALMRDIPKKIIELTLKELEIELYPREQSKSSQKHKQKRMNSAQIQKISHISFQPGHFYLKWVKPLYPNRLIFTTSQLPEKPPNFVSSCYDVFQFTARDMNFQLCDCNSSGSVDFLNIPNVRGHFDQLLRPELWSKDDTILCKLDCYVKDIILTCSLSELIIVRQIIYSSPLTVKRKNVSSKMRLSLSSLQVSANKFSEATCYDGKLKSLNISIQNMDDKGKDQHSDNLILTTSKSENRILAENFCRWIIQMPTGETSIQKPPFMAVMISDFEFILNRKLVNLLSLDVMPLSPNDWTEEFQQSPPRQNFEAVDSSRKSVMIADNRMKRQQSFPQESIHSSTEKEEKHLSSKEKSKPTFKKDMGSRMTTILKSLVIWIDIKQSIITITEELSLKHCPTGSTVIFLPSVQCKCKELNDLKDINITFPIQEAVKDWRSSKSTFPWTCTLNNLAVKTVSLEEERFLVHPINANITLTLDNKKSGKSVETEKQKSGKIEKSSEGEILAFNLHIDTKLISVELSEEQAIILNQSLALLIRSLNSLNVVTQREHAATVSRAEDTDNEGQTSQEVTVKEINDFLALNTNSEDTSSHTITSSNVSRSYETAVYLWMQWTVTKISFSLKGPNTVENKKKLKLNFDFEDFIVSIDRQLDHFKLRCKIGSLGVQCYEWIIGKETEWRANDYFKARVKTITEESQTSDTFFDFTLTVAESENYRRKVQIRQSARNFNKTISEVLIEMKGIDILLDIEKLTEFVPVCCCLSNIATIEDPEMKEREMKAAVVADKSRTGISGLSMLQVKSQGITVYVPVRSEKSWCDVFIFKIGKIHATAEVKNPLTRDPLRPDIYNKAAQLQILHTLGSKLEDKQYELSLENISAATGNWKDILNLMKDETEKRKNTNPAFEWNHQSKKTSLELNSIFNDFLMTVIYAPCMIYRNVVVCGTAIEINCVTDLLMNINTHQLQMMSVVVDSVQNINNFRQSYQNSSSIQVSSRKDSFTEILNKSFTTSVLNSKRELIPGQDLRKYLKHNDSMTLSEQGATTDSGIASSKPKSLYLKHKANSQKEIHYQKGFHQSEFFVPCEITFLAGLFLVKFMKNMRTLEKTSTQDDEASNDDLIPLLALTVAQPSMLIAYRSSSFVAKFFMYTIGVSTHGSGVDEKSSTDDFNSPNIETLAGKVDSTGIPPPLIKFEYKTIFGKRTEMECVFGRPIKLILSCEVFKHLLHTYTTLCEPFIVHYSSEDEGKKQLIYRATIIQNVRQILHNANKFSFSVDKFFIEYRLPGSYDVRGCLGDVSGVVTITERPEKLAFTLSVETLYLQTEHKMFLHPVRFKSKLLMIQENWSSVPLLSINSKFDVIHFDIGPQNIENLITAKNRLLRTLQELNKNFENFKTTSKFRTGSIDDGKLNSNLLKKIDLPEPQRKTKLSREEFYQDDLRAGAFQFVEILNEKEIRLPHPYQIQIISRNNGVVCWRYPQPRRICKLQIYPVPMEVCQPTTIKCRMEYYSDPHSDFLHYTDFSITEMETKDVELPEEKVTACIWRVTILQRIVLVNEECFSGSTGKDDESEDESDYININDILRESPRKNDFILEPRALVACMRIDTAFSPVDIPKIKFLLELALIQVNIQTEQSLRNAGLPEALNKFKLTEDYARTHTFFTIFVTNSKIYAKILNFEEYSVGVDFTLSSKCLDYSCLTMINLLEDTSVRSLVNVKKGINLDIVVDTLKFNLCPAAVHAIFIHQNLWFPPLRDDADEIIIWTRHVICNQTQLPLRVGQVGTEEMITVAAGFCVFYSFRSCYQKKELFFQIILGEDPESFMTSASVSVLKEGNHFIKLGGNVLVVTVSKLSSTQTIIILKGQIEIFSMTSEKFSLQFRSSGAYSMFPEIYIDGKEQLSVFGRCVSDEELYFRLRFLKKDEQPRWSGEIPLKSRKGLPWLVKIPVKDDLEFISFWVRVIREDINSTSCMDTKPIRILIVIYPMFLIQSNFTSQLVASITSSAHNSITLQGRGEIEEISAAATNETKHQISFSNEFPVWHGEDRQDSVLTFSNIDWNKFFWYDEKTIGISEFIENISKPIKMNWPLKDSHFTMDVQLNESLVVPFLKCHPHRDLSCSLMMTISPWSLVVNSLQFNVELRNNSTEDKIQIEAGKIGMIFPIEDDFTIILHLDHGEEIFSDKIYTENSTKSNPKKSLILQQNRPLQLIFSGSSFVAKIFVELSFVDGLRVITMFPAYAIVNFSSHKMNVFPFCLKNKQQVDKVFLEKEASKRFQTPLPKGSSTNINSKGTSLDKFYHFEVEDQATDKIHKKSHHFFVCLSTGNEELSLPLSLSEPFNRKCFSLYCKGKSQSFAAIFLEKKHSFNGGGSDASQYYLFIYDDLSPIILIDNQTQISYLVAESKISNGNRVEAVSECDENHILWTSILRPMSQTYFTPPSTYLTFPDTEKYHYDIVIALKVDENGCSKTVKNIQWSTPIHTGYRSEKYFNVPLHGDVKVVVCDKHNTIKVFIFCVSQQTEFCIKDLRTRLLDPLKNENENQLMMPTPQAVDSDQVKRKECSHDLPEFPIHVNLFVSELSLGIWTESKSKAHLNQEVFSVFADDVSLTYNGMFQTLELYICNLQAENQLYSTGNYDFPVILCSETPYKKIQELPTPVVLKKLIKSYRERYLAFLHINFYEDDLTIETIHCKLNPIRVYIEDTCLIGLKDTLWISDPDNIVYLPARKSEKVRIGSGETLIPKEILKQAVSLSEPLKLRYIRIDPINVILSLQNCVMLYIGFDHSPLAFSHYDRRNVLTVPMRFGQTVGTHYLSGLLFSCGWVVGSLEILGSPSGLARSFTTGIRDFVSMPLQGLFRGPWGFFLGISQGSASLLRNVTAGALNSVTKLAVSVSRNLDRLTLDEEHFQRTEALRRSRPQGLTEGLSHGLTGLGINLLGAIGGLSRHTLEARSTVGIVAGLGKGLFGAIAKPISGAADLVALTGQGMLHTVGYNVLPEQRCQGMARTIIAYPAECKISWQLMPSVLSMDQMLFYHEVTLIAGNELRRSQLILTTTVITVFDIEDDKLIDILPIERVEVAFSNTLISIKVLPESDKSNDDSIFTNERIIRFLKASNDSLPPLTQYSLDELLEINKKVKTQWSLYISEHLGHHLLSYLRLIKGLTRNPSQK